MAVKNKVQLITYPDSLGGDLKTLNNVLTKYFPNKFKGGIHILPPFPSSGDRGFAPLTYLALVRTSLHSKPQHYVSPLVLISNLPLHLQQLNPYFY